MNTKGDLINMPVERLISRYDIIIPAKMPDKIMARMPVSTEAGKVLHLRKPEILSYIRKKNEEEERKAREWSAKVDAIPGLKEIEAARDDLDRWHDEWERSFDDVGGLNVRPQPKYDFDAMKERYPQAFAYLHALALSHDANYEIAAIGARALTKVVNGDYKEALADIQKEQNEFLAHHAFD